MPLEFDSVIRQSCVVECDVPNGTPNWCPVVIVRWPSPFANEREDLSRERTSSYKREPEVGATAASIIEPVDTSMAVPSANHEVDFHNMPSFVSVTPSDEARIGAGAYLTDPELAQVELDRKGGEIEGAGVQVDGRHNR